MTKVADLLAKVLQGRKDALALEDDLERHLKAIHVLHDAMFLVNKLLGDDLLLAVLGTVDNDDREDVLETVALRVHTLSGVFHGLPEDAATLYRVAEEAVSVARGDAPLLFAKGEGPKVNLRIARAKREALIWNAYLKGRGLKAGDRQERIAEAFGRPWRSISAGWRRDIVAALGASHYDFHIKIAEGEGRRGEPRWEMRESQNWEEALAKDGQRFLDAVRENTGNT